MPTRRSGTPADPLTPDGCIQVRFLCGAVALLGNDETAFGYRGSKGGGDRHRLASIAAGPRAA